MKKSEKMFKQPNLGTLSVVLILSLGLPEVSLACPRPCACYVPTEVHCTFRSLTAVPTSISKHVERINLGFNSIQTISENSFAGLAKLELLMIHGNDIQNIPNGALKDLTSLQVFKISYNKLQGITGQTLQGLSSLMRLHMDHNRIEFIHPNAFNGLTSLRLLHLEGNLLRQLHPNTFSTFLVLDYFRLSTIKHLYLSENALRTLPVGIFQKMPLLENVYLHGNPWSCDCRLKWLLEWNEKSSGVLKCKKDKAYEEGQFCPKCSFPKQFQKQDIQNVKDVSCTKPVIQSPLKQNISPKEEEEEDDSSELPMEDFQLSPWNITLNLTDEHGNLVNLNCEIQKPTDSTKIQWNQVSPREIEVNTTISLDLECLMSRDNYEKLWKLIAYYSEVPVKLEREHVLSYEPKVSYHYKQGSDDDALYYTGVKGRIFAEPAWVMQPLIHIQLNRRKSTGKKVVLSFTTRVSQTFQIQENRQQRNSWVMIEHDQYTRAAQSVVEGSDTQLSCNVKASESPSIKWMLPDGTKLKAPFKMEGSRYSVLSSGQLIIRSVAYADSGVYYCVAQVRNDVDTMSYRVQVHPPVIQPPDSETTKVEKNVGESILLPCNAVAIPDAHLSWILPNSHVLHDLSNSSNGYLLHNGTLLIPHSHVKDSGYYRCVAINQQGSDQFSVKVTVNKMISDRSPKRAKFKKHPGSRISVKAREQTIEDDEGSGDEGFDYSPSKRFHLKEHEVSLKQKNDHVIPAQIKKNKKGKGKMKLWKGMDRTEEINVAEGRRVFESRRRINMANKQINPQHWANILAKVRGKNLSRTTAATDPPLSTTTETPFAHQTSRVPPPPIASPPLNAAEEVSEDESSADMSHLSEAELFPVTFPPIINAHDIHQEATHYPAVSAMYSVQHEPSSTAQSLYRTESSIIKDNQFSQNGQTQTWDHSEVKTDHEKSEELEIIDDFTSNEEIITSVPYSQSPLVTIGSEDTAIQYAFSSLELSSVPSSLAKVHLSESSETYFQQKKINEVDNTAISVQSPVNNDVNLKATTPFLTSASPMIEPVLKERSKTEHQQVRISSDPFGLSESLILENTNAQKPESTFTVESTTSPFKKKEWRMATIATDKVTTGSMIATSERKMTVSEPQVIQHPRRRTYGRKRFRLNRFRRPKLILPTAITVKEIPFIQKIPKIEAVTQSAQRSIFRDHQKPDGEIQQANEYEPLEVSSSLTTTVTSLQRSTKAQDTEAPSVHQLFASLPEIPVTLSNSVKDPKSHLLVTTQGPPTTTAMKELYLSHLSEQVLTTPTDNELIKVWEGNTIRANNEITKAHRTRTSVPIQSFTSSLSPSDLSPSMISEFAEESFPFGSSENVLNPRVALSRPPTVQYMTTIKSTREYLKTPSNADKVHNVSETPPVTTFATSSHQKETMTLPHYSTMDGHLFTPTERKELINPWQSRTSIFPSSKENITQLDDHHDKTAVYTSEKNYPPVLPIASIPLATTLHPLIQSTLTLSDHSSTKKNYTYGQPANPDNKGSTADNIKGKLSSRHNELSTFHSNHNRITTQQKQGQLKEPYGGRSYNSLSPNILRQPIGMIPVFNQPPVYVPPKHIPARGTMKTPYLMVPGLFHHFVTQQIPLRYTNKPEITAYAAQTTQDRKNSSYTETFPTTTPALLYRPKVHTPSRYGNQGESRYTSYSRVFANNYLPEIKDKPGRTINQVVPHFSNSRMPFLINRTRVFQHLGVNSKPAVPNVRASVSTTEKKFLPPPSTVTQSPSLKATAMPSPPISLVTVPTIAVATPTFLTPSTRSQTTSSTSSSRNFHHHNPNVLFVPKLGGVRPLNSSIMQPSTLFRTQGEKPKIITKKSNSLSILAESDAIIPCDATGEPKPLLSWTKISTGALMTANTRIQRFEVLKNGTFIIRNVQLQDRGQYLCTAQNLHGTDKMIVLLSVLAQQPKMLGPRFRDVTVYFGEKVTMDCQANGIPNPHISWIFPDRKILQTVSTTEGRVMLYENRTLSLGDTSFSDRGVYKCIASNAAGADSIAVRLHVAALPPIIQQEKVENISLSVGQNINIHCSAKAAPLPGIRWVLFDGTQIRTSQFVHGNLFVFPNGTLYIRNVSPKDSGSYECIAANMVGAARRTVWLHVKKQSTNAKITGSSPQRTDVTYGSALRLDCSASGDPWPRILWRLPSKRMVDSLHSLDSRIKVFGNGTLVVHSVTDKDAGDYLCVARNKIGDDYVVLKVNVMMKPAKIEHKNENNHKVIYGGDLKVDCVATGLPNPEISWSLPDGSMINTFMQSDDSGSRTKRYVVFNNGTLYFNDVGLREEGDYTCYAENQIGKDEMKVRVKVVAEPAIIRNKTYTVLNIHYGDVVSVGCEAKGEPTPKVIWLSPSNRPIPLLSDKYQVYKDGTLLIQKAQRSDSGNYTCVARNSAGEDRKVVWVHVNVQPPRINGHLSTITSMREMALRDSRKLIDCKAEGIPSPRVMWAFPEGVILPAPYYGNRITVHRNGTLDIRGVRQTDSVQLVCIGRNEGGEARLIVQLQVMDHVEKPTFKDPTTERITAAAGHSINLNCSVQGNPQPSTAWILPNGTELQKGSHLQRFYHKRDGILHISALSATDAGTYRCTAQNSGGYVERVVFLKVGLKPEISNQYNNLVSIINGETLQLHCITQPSQQARITWTLPNGMVLDSPQTLGRFSLSENGSLTVREASVFDRGTYLCKVVTEYGSSLMNVPVIVIAYPPRITSEPAPIIYARPGNTVKLNCMAIGIPKAEITWEIPDKSHLTTGAQSRLYGNKFLHPQGSLIIQQATQRDAGFYKCTAKNILGSDSKATYIHIF